MSVAGAYLEIALRLGRLVPDWVDSYTGPPGLAESVAAQDAISAADLGERVQALADRVGHEVTDPARSRWLLVAGEMRRRCRERSALPADEEVAWELVRGEPWAGYASYLGQRRSRIRINVDLPIGAFRLLDLVCHEAYPGHHSDHVCKDAALVQADGREEVAVFVYPTPQALMAEGLACCALEALLGDEAERVAAECLQSSGVNYDHETAAGVREAQALLLPVRSNVALMLDGGASSQEARDYARTWLLEDAELIDKMIGALEGQAWRPYESCYPVGLDLCRRYVTSGRGSFHDLLSQQLTPADLR